MSLRSDIEIDGQEYTIHMAPQQAAMQETGVPQLAQGAYHMGAGGSFQWTEEPLMIDTFHQGAFYSQWNAQIPGVYAYGTNFDGRYPRTAMPGPFMNSVTLTGSTDHARAAVDYNGDLYVAAGRYIYKIAGGNGTVTQDLDLGVNNVGWSLQSFLGNLYAGQAVGSGSTSVPGLLRKKSAGAWDAGTGTVKTKHQTQVFYATDYRWFGSDTISSVINAAADPFVAANTSASIPIGDGSSSTSGINRLLNTARHVYVAKTSGLHDLDGATGYSPNLTPFYSHINDDENGIAGHAFGGYIFTSHQRGLFRVQAFGQNYAQVDTVTPGHGTGNETPIRGKITASIADGGWTVVAVYNGNDTYICYGRAIGEGEQSIGSSPMLWHGGLITLTGQKCYLLHISGLTSPPRLWIGTGAPAGPFNLQWCVLPRTEHPLQDSEYQFATAYSVFIAPQTWGRAATVKNLLQIDVEGDNLTGGTTLSVNTNSDGSGYSLFGIANYSPQSSLAPSTDYLGRRIGLRLDGTGTSSAGPIVRGLLLRAAVRVAVRPMRVYQLDLSEGSQDRMGGRTISRPAVLHDKLQRLTSGSRVVLRDEFGRKNTVLIQGPVEFSMVAKRAESGKGTQEPALVATIRMTILSTQGNAQTAIWGQNRWGDSSVWN